MKIILAELLEFFPPSWDVWASEFEEDSESDSDLAYDEELRPPKRYQVILHNDDFTTMEFVMEVLQRFFKKTEHQAYALMMSIHEQGMAVCGVYSFEVAETKSHQVTQYAKKQGHPLRATISPE